MARSLAPTEGEAPRRARARLLAAVAALVPLACAPEVAPPPRPNLLLLSIDTLRADRLACYGGPEDVGTAICSLADGGVRFRWAFSTAASTVPSIASLLTSRYPAQHRVRQVGGNALAAEELTVAEVLAARGYATAAFVSNPVLDAVRQLGQGFDVYDQDMSRSELNRPGLAEREAERTVDAVLAWLQTDARPPWFVWVHFQDPHGPYEPPDAAPAADAPDAPRLALLDGASGRGGIPDYQALPGVFSVAAYEQRYLDEIRYLDRQVARLLARLDAVRPRPIVVLTADHGEAFGEEGYYFAHGHSVALEQIRVPLLWRGEPAGEGRVVDEPVSLVDIAPSLIAAAGLPVPRAFGGRPLPLDEATPAGRPPVFAEHRDETAVVLGRVYFSRGSPAAVQRGRPQHRHARLGRSDALPEYLSSHGAVGSGALSLHQAALARFRRRAEKAGVPPRAAEVSPELRERMRALGYGE